MAQNEKWHASASSKSPNDLKVHTLAHLGHLDLAISRARRHPEEIRYIDRHGRSVLHQVMRKNPSLSNIQDLLDLYPEAIDREDSFDRSPVDIALCYGANSDVVEYMERRRSMSQQNLHTHEDVSNVTADNSTDVTAGNLTSRLFDSIDYDEFCPNIFLMETKK
eukprot:CAMPEP_0194395534 /NCGR_PEP_ID=MMETSP0174-20130528/124477_1 /TAXON_ID=216777 /ORGANISM="Proboscia alata, Strain PI-D3" /LENGTH=163 /DNA_ID=CAMNT_0039191481 /DNA_START=41 /DNA_END=532 /DNA_ORIENTATION=-